MSLTKMEVLQYLFLNAGATVKDLAGEFSYAEGSIRAYMNTLNSRGLVKKNKGEDGKLSYFLTKSGEQRLNFLEEKLESEEQGEENFEKNKPSGGNKKMSRQSRQIVDDEEKIWACPKCEQEYTLVFPVDEDDLYCEECDELLEPISE